MKFHGRTRAGFTLLEVMISLGIFSVVGYGIAVALKAGGSMQGTVVRVSNDDREMRGASRRLLDELQDTADSKITTLTGADGNTTLRFQQPVDNAGTHTWGVFDREIGTTDADHTRVGWYVNYLTRMQGGKRQLVRQELDAALAVQREKVITDGVRAGGATPPGFRVQKVGAVWQVTLSTDGEQGQEGIRTVFHVRTRN